MYVGYIKGLKLTGATCNYQHAKGALSLLPKLAGFRGCCKTWTDATVSWKVASLWSSGPAPRSNGARRPRQKHALPTAHHTMAVCFWCHEFSIHGACDHAYAAFLAFGCRRAPRLEEAIHPFWALTHRFGCWNGGCARRFSALICVKKIMLTLFVLLLMSFLLILSILGFIFLIFIFFIIIIITIIIITIWKGSKTTPSRRVFHVGMIYSHHRVPLLRKYLWGHRGFPSSFIGFRITFI